LEDYPAMSADLVDDLSQTFASQDMVCFMTMDLEYAIGFNAQCLRNLLGYGDLTGVNFVNQLLAPTYRKWFEKILKDQQGLAMYDALPLMRSDNTQIWISFRCFPVRRWSTPTKPLYCYFASVMDVTMQRSKALESIKTGAIPELTSAERAVARTIVQEMPIKLAAEHLGLSSRTIENHRLHIRKKLQITGTNRDLREALLSLSIGI
jgi:DNA-binding CsgD family transcriptional regulator